MNIIIKPGAATDDVKQIENIISEMTEDMAELHEAINETIPDGIETDWSDRVKQNWYDFYRADIPEAMETIRLSASNLTMAINAALAYSEEKK